MVVKITFGNVRTLLDEMTRHLKGNLFADKGFISGDLFKQLYQKDLKLIKRIWSSLKTYHMNLSHTQHRPLNNCYVNILSCLVADQLKHNKPSFKSSTILIQN